MRTLVTSLSAVLLTVASASVSAWGWNNNGFNDSWGDTWDDTDFGAGFNMNFRVRGSGRGHDYNYNSYRSYHGYGYNPYEPGPAREPARPKVAATTR